ncbi:hypothetical protein ACVIM8_007514 [Bradyrhizobium sp. USDA 4529]
MHPARGRGQGFARLVEIGGRDRKTRTVAAEHEGEFAALQRIGDGGDHRGAGHVDRLVALRRDRLGRFHDIGDADRPVIRQRRIQRGVHQPREAAKHRNAAVEDIAAASHRNAAPFPP